MVAEDNGVSISADMEGGLPTPAADGTKPEIDEDELLVKDTIVSQPSPGSAKGNMLELPQVILCGRITLDQLC